MAGYRGACCSISGGGGEWGLGFVCPEFDKSVQQIDKDNNNAIQLRFCDP